jgi:tripartite-type tricarboxylate transporter receptor subunit TctC
LADRDGRNRVGCRIDQRGCGAALSGAPDHHDRAVSSRRRNRYAGSKTRLSASPDIPTADEAGLTGFVASLWYGLWVPKDTPKDIVEKLNSTLRQVLADRSVEKRFVDLGIEISPSDQQSPEALRAYQKAETERWWPIIKAFNLKGE